MSTKRLKKRDRSWAKDMVLCWRIPFYGRGYSTGHLTRIARAQDAQAWIDGKDLSQQEALDAALDG